MLDGYKNMTSEWLLDEIIKEANTVEFPSESNLLFELRSLLLSRCDARAREQRLAKTALSKEELYALIVCVGSAAGEYGASETTDLAHQAIAKLDAALEAAQTAEEGEG